MLRIGKRNLLITVPLLVGFSISNAITPDAFEEVRNKPGFSAQIPPDLCHQEFPFFKTVIRKLHSSGVEDFSIFAFTTREFNPAIGSLLVVHGGPGGIWNLSGAMRISKLFPDHNVVFFHYRGGGCSSLPSSDPSLDKKISSIATVADIEGIRSAYKIKKWKSVVGFSYGTNIARMYAHFNPEKTESIILEGLDQPGRRDRANVQDTVDSKTQLQNIIGIIAERYQQSQDLQRWISPDNFKIFIEKTFPEYLTQVPPTTNYHFLGFWESYKDQYETYYEVQNKPLPRYLNHQTYAAVTALAYANADASSDPIILSLISQFSEIELPANFRSSVNEQLNNMAYMFFPFLNPNYLDYFKNGQLVSLRVQMAMPENDKKGSAANLCNSVKTIVINGTVDSATPVENVRSYLGNKVCSRHPRNLALIVKGGGHSNLTSMSCLSDFVAKFINGTEDPNSLNGCALPVSLERF